MTLWDVCVRCVWELQALDVVKQQATVGKASAQAEVGWEIVMEEKTFKVWRRPVEGSHLFEYRGERLYQVCHRA